MHAIILRFIRCGKFWFKHTFMLHLLHYLLVLTRLLSILKNSTFFKTTLATFIAMLLQLLLLVPQFNSCNLRHKACASIRTIRRCCQHVPLVQFILVFLVGFFVIVEFLVFENYFRALLLFSSFPGFSTLRWVVFFSIFCWFLKFSDLFLLVCCWQLVVWVWVLRGVYVCYLVSFLHWVFVFVRIRWLLLLQLLQVCCGLFGDLVLLNANNQQLCCSLFMFVFCLL